MKRITEETIIFNADLKIQEAVLVEFNLNQYYKRKRILKKPRAALFLFNTENKCLILTRQFRYAIHDECQNNLLELPAG